jgi:hypothetical protein
MKVYLNKYRDHWVSPYTIAQKLCFWRKIDYDEPWVQVVNKVLQPVCKTWMIILDVVHPKINYVKIDKWDTWSMDSTLSPIILPMLRQLRKTQHGAPHVDDKDVPKTLRSTTKSAQKAKKNPWDPDGNYFRRWNWVMDQMIWSFEQLCDDDWEKQFYSGKSDYQWVKNDNKTMSLQRGPNDTFKWDKAGHTKHSERIQVGLVLFGKYFQNLWD